MDIVHHTISRAIIMDNNSRSAFVSACDYATNNNNKYYFEQSEPKIKAKHVQKWSSPEQLVFHTFDSQTTAFLRMNNCASVTDRN